MGIHLVDTDLRPAFLDREVTKMITTLLRKEEKQVMVMFLVKKLLLGLEP